MAFCNLDKCIYYGVGKYDFPELEPFNGELPSRWIRFTDIGKFPLSEKTGVHFFQDDAKFEAIWNRPNKYIDKFKKIGVLCQPDFSVYTDFPRAVQIYNKYRNHWLARFYQDRNITVIPTIAWSDESSYDWCFDGEPHGGIVAVSTIGVLKAKESLDLFMEGYEAMLGKLEPTGIICLTNKDDCDLLGKDKVAYINVSTFTHKPIKI
jgi:hypothetical protein